MNITLIGMAGSGKSHVGEKFAERYGFRFVDNDKELESTHGIGIQELLDKMGPQRYLDEEARVFIKSSRGQDGLMLAPGGSIIYRGRTMDYVKDISHVIYLHVPYETVETRLKSVPPRAIIGLGWKSLQELYDERHPLYLAHADLVVEADEGSPEGVMATIADFAGLDSDAFFES
jgi:shikimate kinase